MRNAIGLTAVLLGAAIVANGAESIPRGSYKESCRNIKVNGSTLSAECKGREGKFWPTHLQNYDRCKGVIVNDDGQLVCSKCGGARGPCGSYRETCTDITVTGELLRARCQIEDARGHRSDYVETSLRNFERCKDIVNDNGKLVCH